MLFCGRQARSLRTAGLEDTKALHSFEPSVPTGIHQSTGRNIPQPLCEDLKSYKQFNVFRFTPVFFIRRRRLTKASVFMKVCVQFI